MSEQMEIKIDNSYRISIPKKILDLMGVNISDNVFLVYNPDKSLSIYNKKRYNVNEIISKRLKNKDITNSERNFLERLLKEI